VILTVSIFFIAGVFILVQATTRIQEEPLKFLIYNYISREGEYTIVMPAVLVVTKRHPIIERILKLIKKEKAGDLEKYVFETDKSQVTKREI